MKIKSLVGSCAVMIGLAGVAQAHEGLDSDGKFSVLLGAGKYMTDSDRGLDNGVAGEIGLGYIINKHWAIEAIYSNIDSLTNDAGADVDADMYRLDGLYHFNRYGHWTPYLAAGVGQIDFDTAGGGDDNDTVLNFGGGVKYAITNAASLRADVRAIHGHDDDDVDTLASLGLTYVFGSSSAPAAAAAEPAPAPAPAPAPIDSDGDGVTDDMDKCPGTAPNLVVDSDGCPVMTVDSVSIDLEVLFDNDKSDVKAAFIPGIQKAADFMNTYPNTTAVIEGHTDSVGEAAYNQKLSQRRADAVRTVMVKQMNVDAGRLTAKGFGESQPRASNDTADGRQQNRRVVAVVSANVKKPVTK